MYLSKAGALAKIESEHLDLRGVHLPTLNVAAIYQVKYNLYVPWTQMMTYEKYVGIIRWIVGWIHMLNLDAILDKNRVLAL